MHAALSGSKKYQSFLYKNYISYKTFENWLYSDPPFKIKKTKAEKIIEEHKFLNSLNKQNLQTNKVFD